MMRLRFLVPLVGLSSLCAFACSGSGDGVGGGEGGAGGEPTLPAAGEGGGSGEGGGGASCVEGGLGTLNIEISGLPADVTPEVLIDGPDPLAPSDPEITFDDVASGEYTVTAGRVFDADAIVRTVYEPRVERPTWCLADGGEQVVRVTYTAIPTSNKLWMGTDRDDELAAFDSFALAESGITDAGIAIDASVGKALAFDRDGNLWTFGLTTADPPLARFAAADLGESGAASPDVEINVLDIPCGPQLRSLAFDPDGNLWLSVCGGEIHRLPAAELETSGDKTADIVVVGDEANIGVAFDAAGNLWVANGPSVLRYDAATLAESTADADAVLTPKDGNLGFEVSYLAFDAAGNLWGNDFGANVIFKLDAAELDRAGEAEVDVGVSIAISVGALFDQMAFDDGGGLWLGLGQDNAGVGSIGRLSPAQLNVSSSTGDPTVPAVVLDSASIGAGLPVAFFPAAEGLPLFHALPRE